MLLDSGKKVESIQTSLSILHNDHSQFKYERDGDYIKNFDGTGYA